MLDRYLKQLQEGIFKVHDVGPRSPLFSKLSKQCSNMSETQRQAILSKHCRNLDKKNMKLCLQKTKRMLLQKEINCIKSVMSKCGTDKNCKEAARISIINLTARLKKYK